MKRTRKRLSLDAQTIRVLTDQERRAMVGGVTTSLGEWQRLPDELLVRV